ncbi:uncharacterized protein JCM6883_007633 [Sporobolomyces salmoneus]|uniref:uncharacterized protein n=1 Tax=Sporobolomyces salmoneus TaxID=183962 RepID=UPI0031825E95
MSRKGRQKVTPPPDQSTSVPRPSTPARVAPPQPPSSSTGPARSPSKRPHTPPRSTSRRPLPASEKLDDINFDDFSNELSEDDIQDPDTEPEPDTQHSSSSQALMNGSPTKKAKFTSFSTPTKASSSAATKGGGGYAEVKNDPDSPFHSIKRNLFGGEGNVDSSHQAPPPSSPSHVPATTATDSLSSLTLHLDTLPSLLASVKKDRERDQRLIEVGKRKEEMWRNRSAKVEAENQTLKGEMEGLKDKVRKLEEEVRELRTRR